MHTIVRDLHNNVKHWPNNNKSYIATSQFSSCRNRIYLQPSSSEFDSMALCIVYSSVQVPSQKMFLSAMSKFLKKSGICNSKFAQQQFSRHCLSKLLYFQLLLSSGTDVISEETCEEAESQMQLNKQNRCSTMSNFQSNLVIQCSLLI